jgi:hypothetical protein
MQTEAPPEESAIIALDEYESTWAARVGYYRHEESERRGRKQSDLSNSKNALDNHKRGAAAELALTKYLRVPWNATVNTFNAFPDLDGQMDARGKVASQPYLRLYERKDSKKQHFIFVSVSRLGNRRFRIDGWMLGRDAMQPKYYRPTGTLSKHPEWQPPVSDLRPARTLKAEVTRRVREFNEARTKFEDEMRKATE